MVVTVQIYPGATPQSRSDSLCIPHIVKPLHILSSPRGRARIIALSDISSRTYRLVATKRAEAAAAASGALHGGRTTGGHAAVRAAPLAAGTASAVEVAAVGAAAARTHAARLVVAAFLCEDGGRQEQHYEQKTEAHLDLACRICIFR